MNNLELLKCLNFRFFFKNINNDSEEEHSGGILEPDDEEEEDGNDTSPSSTESGMCAATLEMRRSARIFSPRRRTVNLHKVRILMNIS
jgi:hypothetical protein